MADTTCRQPDCEKLASTRGWCDRHYGAQYRSGLEVRTRRAAVSDVNLEELTCTCPVHGTHARMRVRRRKHGEHYVCRKCDRGQTPISKAASSRKRKYGLSTADFELMLIEQRGLCLICREAMVDIQVDHDHATGKVRGLLCRGCNVGLGFFRDDISTMKRAVHYLAGTAS